MKVLLFRSIRTEKTEGLLNWIAQRKGIAIGLWPRQTEGQNSILFRLKIGAVFRKDSQASCFVQLRWSECSKIRHKWREITTGRIRISDLYDLRGFLQKYWL